MILLILLISGWKTLINYCFHFMKAVSFNFPRMKVQLPVSNLILYESVVTEYYSQTSKQLLQRWDSLRSKTILSWKSSDKHFEKWSFNALKKLSLFCTHIILTFIQFLYIFRLTYFHVTLAFSVSQITWLKMFWLNRSRLNG